MVFISSVREHPSYFLTATIRFNYEFPGGCEDPRIVETEEGNYVMTYTQWNRGRSSFKRGYIS